MLLTMLQLLFGMLLLSVTDVVAQTNQSSPSTCTDACWLQGLTESGCIGKADETQCMCSSETNYLYFFDCNLTCLFEDTFTGLNSAMECIGFKRDLLVTSATPASTASVDLPSPTTFETRVKRAPEAQIAALTPWRTEAPKRKPQWSSYTAASFPGATIWYCGVPGAACGEKAAVASNTEPDAFNDTDSETLEKRQANIGPLMSVIDALAQAEAAETNLVGTYTYTGNKPRDAPMAEPTEHATFTLPASVTGPAPHHFGPPEASIMHSHDGDRTTRTEHHGHLPSAEPHVCMVEGTCDGA
ncbi:hypothetical protein LTR35_010476 [Friedmanniomyces endolithicus]|nr:hypothetical protein LTR35_010476 [Friedmanniomyces endolithicus]KAK0294150.1 hypothetical protein LTS00_007124 [Friedmanniomyces endolithicus]KAK1003384.1 hypothetical protein LTR54_007898 [Friedmanniomyces endolithicus]